MAIFPQKTQTEYKTRAADSYDTGINPTWHTDHAKLGSLCALITLALRPALDRTAPVEEIETAKCIVCDLITCYSHRLDTLFPGSAPVSKVPWGSLWY